MNIFKSTTVSVIHNFIRSIYIIKKNCFTLKKKKKKKKFFRGKKKKKKKKS